MCQILTLAKHTCIKLCMKVSVNIISAHIIYICERPFDYDQFIQFMEDEICIYDGGGIL